MQKRKQKDFYEPKVVNIKSKKTVSSTQNGTNAHVNSQRLAAHTDVVSGLTGGHGQRILPQIKKLFSTDTCWQKEISFLQCSVTTEHVNHNPGKVPNSRSSWPAQNEFHDFFMGVLACLFVCFVGVLFVFVFVALDRARI